MPGFLPLNRCGCKSGLKDGPQKLQQNWQRAAPLHPLSPILPVTTARVGLEAGPIRARIPQRVVLVAMLGKKRRQSRRIQPSPDIFLLPPSRKAPNQAFNLPQAHFGVVTEGEAEYAWKPWGALYRDVPVGFREPGHSMQFGVVLTYRAGARA